MFVNVGLFASIVSSDDFGRFRYFICLSRFFSTDEVKLLVYEVEGVDGALSRIDGI